jgi:hypothetical protein
MKPIPSILLNAASLAAGLSASAGEGLDPYKGRQSRAEEFDFAAKPRVEKRGGKYAIAFAAKAACDGRAFQDSMASLRTATCTFPAGFCRKTCRS